MTRQSWPSATTTVVATIGDPIRHSLSPALHQAAFEALDIDWVSVAFEVPAGGGADAIAGMRALGLAGLSVTMPHKSDVARAVDELTPEAERLGAVNCVWRRGEVLIGDSTDGQGFLAALVRGAGFLPEGKRCVVLGAGGAARAVVDALAWAGASEVAVINRTQSRAEDAASLAREVGRVGSASDVAGADLVVQATPVGMAGARSNDLLLFDPDSLHAGQVVSDLVYHPARTLLLEEASRRGATAVNGLGMLVHQAALALERWTRKTAPLEEMWRAVQPGGA